MLVCLPVVSSCYHATMAELSSYSRDSLAHKDHNIYYPAPYKRKFANLLPIRII